MAKINYVPAFYYGPRMHSLYSSTLQKNAFFMVDKQIEALNKYGKGIDLVTFVFNLDNLNDGEIIKREISKREVNFKYEVLCRLNRGASYGAWDEVIKKNLNDFDYFFIIEDDFIPAAEEFYQPFIDRCVNNVAYVCMFADKDRPYLNVPHAAIPHGVVDGAVCRKVMSNQGNVFKIYNHENSYSVFYKIQMEFFEYFVKEGYVISDILDQYSSPYMDSSNISTRVYGNPVNPVLVSPIPNPT